MKDDRGLLELDNEIFPGVLVGVLVEQLRENLADFNEKHFQKVCRNRLDGQIACHVPVRNSRFLQMIVYEIGQVFSQPLYGGTSLHQNSAPLGPDIRPMPRALWWS